MGIYQKCGKEINKIFVGADIHQKTWYITIISQDRELFHANIPSNWKYLKKLLERYREHWIEPENIELVYEAGYFGFNLYDEICEWGSKCIVTPPSLIPQEQGNRVKTDRLDSRKLALLLSKGMLKRIYVPNKQQRCHRNVLRRRRQLVRDRVRIQNRLKSELRFFGLDLPDIKGKWSKLYIENLRRINFGDSWQQESFSRLLDEYDFLDKQTKLQTVLLKKLSETKQYRENVKVLRSITGIGLITAMELLLEIGDFSRFRKGNRLAAYVGLTPSQYSSSDKIRMGRITRTGKDSLRGALIEASWLLIAKESKMRDKYNDIKMRAGGKRAIVAIARKLLLRCRHMILAEQQNITNKVA